MSAPKPTQMNGKDDDLVGDWVLVDKEEEQEEEGRVTKLEKVVTLKEDHFRPPESDDRNRFVSLSELYSPVGGYESGKEDKDEIAEFMEDLRSFYTLNNLNPFDRDDKDDNYILSTDHQFHLLKLWRAVTELGGYEQVTSGELWGQVGQKLGLPSNVTRILPGCYEKTLLEYEKHKLGNSNDEDADEYSYEDTDEDAYEDEDVPRRVIVLALPAFVEPQKEQNGKKSQVPAKPESQVPAKPESSGAT